MPCIGPFPKSRLYAQTPEGDDVPDFLPWVALRRRANGWSIHDQRLFIHELTRCGSVAMAAKAVGKSPRSAYALRDKLGAQSFAAAWVRAIAIGIEKVRTCLTERFIDGELIPRFYHGRIIARVRKYNDRAMLAVLQSLNRCLSPITGSERLGNPSMHDWGDAMTTLDDYRARLENWEGALRAREWKLDWDIQEHDEEEADWERTFRLREWERQERAAKRAALRASVKAERAAWAAKVGQAGVTGPRIRSL